MAAEFERLSKLEFFKWKKEDENWASFLAELRTAILMTQRQVNTRAPRTKELATSGQRDNLVNLMTVLEDLCDLEATAIIEYVTALKVTSETESISPETLATIEAEETASKEFAATTQACIKAATKIAKNVSEKLDDKAARGQRVSHRALSQDTLDGQHHSDPPNKLTMATDLKPEQLVDTISQLDLDDWVERAEAWAEASNIIRQSNTVQLGYLQAIVKPEMWTLFKEYCETNMILQTDTDFEKGLELLRETYYKKNDVFILIMKTAADVFKGKTFSELQTWFFKYRQSAKNCGLTTMTEDEQYNFKLLTSMTEKMQKLLFVQNARPALQETLDFIENQVVVENMTKAPTKVADTVNNVLDDAKKTEKLRCWDCNGQHKRPARQTRNLCTAGDARFQAIPTRLVGEGGDQQEAHHNPATPHARPQLLQPPAHLLNPNMRTRRRRNEKSEVRNKDDLAGTNARPPKPHQPVEAGQTASHVAGRAERRKQRGKFVTQST